MLKKHLIFVQKIGYGFGGYPPPPLNRFVFREKGVTDLGDTPPITDKTRKVVFNGAPYRQIKNTADKNCNKSMQQLCDGA